MHTSHASAPQRLVRGGHFVRWLCLLAGLDLRRPGRPLPPPAGMGRSAATGPWARSAPVTPIVATGLPSRAPQVVAPARPRVTSDLGSPLTAAREAHGQTLAEIADTEGVDTANSSVRITIHAGEPGASLPATKARIESAWGSRCYDHTGATEVGAWGFECQAQSGVHLNEGEFIFDVINPDTGESADEGELVVTNLGRVGTPVIRYRTGDWVKLQTEPCECGRSFRQLKAGIIGRIDDVLIVRGVNVYPSAIENIVRGFPEVGEFVVDVFRSGELDELEIRLEIQATDTEEILTAVAQRIRNALGLRVNAKSVPRGTLPRFELKAKRFADHRRLNDNHSQ